MLLYEVSNTEEPCAEKPHAGICERAVGQLAVLSRWPPINNKMNDIINIIRAMFLLVAVVIPAYADDGKCLKYEPATIELTGIVKTKTFPGPPEYRSVKEGDKPEPYWVLYLSKSVCVDGDPKNDINPTENNVKSLQLVMIGNYDKYRNLLGQKVTVKGELFHAITGHHHTDVLITVKEIKKARQKN